MYPFFGCLGLLYIWEGKNVHIFSSTKRQCDKISCLFYSNMFDKPNWGTCKKKKPEMRLVGTTDDGWTEYTCESMKKKQG